MRTCEKAYLICLSYSITSAAVSKIDIFFNPKMLVGLDLPPPPCSVFVLYLNTGNPYLKVLDISDLFCCGCPMPICIKYLKK